MKSVSKAALIGVLVVVAIAVTAGAVLASGSDPSGLGTMNKDHARTHQMMCDASDMGACDGMQHRWTNQGVELTPSGQMIAIRTANTNNLACCCTTVPALKRPDIKTKARIVRASHLEHKPFYFFLSSLTCWPPAKRI